MGCQPTCSSRRRQRNPILPCKDRSLQGHGSHRCSSDVGTRRSAPIRLLRHCAHLHSGLEESFLQTLLAYWLPGRVFSTSGSVESFGCRNIRGDDCDKAGCSRLSHMDLLLSTNTQEPILLWASNIRRGAQHNFSATT